MGSPSLDFGSYLGAVCVIWEINERIPESLSMFQRWDTRVA